MISIKFNISCLFIFLSTFLPLFSHINKPIEILDKNILSEAISQGFIVEKKNKLVIRSIYPITRLKNCEEILACLFKLGLDIDKPFFYNDSKWETLLMIAAGQGNANLVSFLLDKGVSTEALDFWKETALMYAVYRGYNDIIDLLVKHGAIFDKIKQGENGFGIMPIYYSLIKNNAEAMKIFIDNGLSMYTKVWSLYFAIFQRNTTIIELLLKSGIDLNFLEYELAIDVMSIILARENEDSKICHRIRNMFFKMLPVDLPYFLLIALDIDKGIGKLLLDHGANPNLMVDEHKTSSVLAAFVKQDDIEAVKLLLKYGATVDTKDRYKKAPIDYAIQRTNNEMIDLLIAHGAETSYPRT